MTTYIIKFHDEHGDWFFTAPNRWSDSAADAFRFTDKSVAEEASIAAEHRFNKGRKSAPMFKRPDKALAKCRVISMRPMA